MHRLQTIKWITQIINIHHGVAEEENVTDRGRVTQEDLIMQMMIQIIYILMLCFPHLHTTAYLGAAAAATAATGTARAVASIF